MPWAERACPAAGLSKDHPDPDGFHLAAVAAVAKLYLDGSDEYKGAKGSPLAAAFNKAGLSEDATDFALFWDFARRVHEGLVSATVCAHVRRVHTHIGVNTRVSTCHGPSA